MSELSGAAWVAQFPTSRSLDDLSPGFKASVNDFIGAVKAAGGKVNIAATYRPPERAYLSERRWADIEKMIRRAIADFEPRLLPGSVVVKPMRQGQGDATYNILQFEISAMLHMEPYPVEFTVQSAVDLETNRISILRS